MSGLLLYSRSYKDSKGSKFCYWKSRISLWFQWLGDLNKKVIEFDVSQVLTKFQILCICNLWDIALLV